MRAFLLTAAVLAASATVPAPSPQEPATAPASTVEQVIERAGLYLARYADDLSVIIGTEHYAQYMGNEGFERAAKRLLVSEFALVRANDDWLGFRDVYEIDGKPVGDRQDRLRRLFLENGGAAISQARRINDESARHNLGSVVRNFNPPTMALLFLRPANAPRFHFRKDGEDTVDGTRVWKIRYEEQQKPTMIRTSAGKDMPLKGTFWIDPAGGRVFRTHMEIVIEVTTGPAAHVKSSASISVSYKQDEKLGLLLPSDMRETYESPSVNRFTGNEEMSTVNCRATYSDFKSFETGARLLPPK